MHAPFESKVVRAAQRHTHCKAINDFDELDSDATISSPPCMGHQSAVEALSLRLCLFT